MSQYLPTGGFKWVKRVGGLIFDDNKNPIKVSADNGLHIQMIYELSKIANDPKVGFIFEVDLDYPENLHDAHNDLPFCPEKKKFSKTCTKLIANLHNKRNYIIHYKNLLQCLKHGLVLTKVHQILQFNQDKWLKTYIDKNTNYRNLAKSQFEKDFFKLLNNAVYGKTMENVEKYKDVKIVSQWDDVGRRRGARALIARPNCDSVSVISNNIAIIQLKSEIVTPLDFFMSLLFWTLMEYIFGRNPTNSSIILLLFSSLNLPTTPLLTTGRPNILFSPYALVSKFLMSS